MCTFWTKVLTEEERAKLTMVYSHRMTYQLEVLFVIEKHKITGYH